jgi:trans-aconitate methyltransferase
MTTSGGPADRRHARGATARSRQGRLRGLVPPPGIATLEPTQPLVIGYVEQAHRDALQPRGGRTRQDLPERCLSGQQDRLTGPLARQRPLHPILRHSLPPPQVRGAGNTELVSLVNHEAVDVHAPSSDGRPARATRAGEGQEHRDTVLGVASLWASGAAYERYVGRWSRLVAAEFLDWLDVAPEQRWFDVGCGTGALTAAIVTHCSPISVTGIDSSEAFVASAREHIDDSRVRFEVGDATSVPPNSADVVVSGLVLNFLPDQAAAVTAMRAAAPTGSVAAYIWDYADRMQLMRYFWDAATALDPGAADLDEGRRFGAGQPARLEALWRAAGFVDVSSRAIDVRTVFRNFDDYWTPFLGAQGPAPAYTMSLDEAHRDRLRDSLRARLPTEADGSLRLVARAWAVRGRAAGS